MVDLIELDDATAYSRCACGRDWWRLSDGGWLLTAHGRGKVTIPNTPTVAVLPAAGLSTGAGQYLRAERHADPRPHLEGHALSAWRGAHPSEGPLTYVVGPPLARLLKDAAARGLVPFLDAGELAIGRPASGVPNTERESVPSTHPAALTGEIVAEVLLVSRLAEYAPLIRAHLAGETVACRAKKCTQAATRMALPARPVCEKHANAVIRAEVIPALEVALPVELPKPVAETEAAKLAAGLRQLAEERHPVF